jgi:hypothetical protein
MAIRHWGIAVKSVLRQGCAVKYAWIEGQRAAYPLPAMRTTLAVSSSGYRA